MRHTSFPEGKGTGTPWGTAQTSQVLTRGVVAYSTAGHGGVSVTINWAKKNLTPQAQHLGMPWGGKLWYEEGCKVSILFYEHPEFYAEIRPEAQVDVDLLRKNDENSIRAYDAKYFDPEFQGRCLLNPIDPELIPGDEIVLMRQPYRVTGAQDSKGRIKLAGNLFVRASTVLVELGRVTRNGETVWSRPS